jgi:hypothetical protein
VTEREERREGRGMERKKKRERERKITRLAFTNICTYMNTHMKSCL